MRYEFKSGSFYEGDIVDDMFEGEGIFHFHNGDSYKGKFKNDKFNGVGEYSFKSGNIYRGLFADDKFNGIGTLIYSDGTIEKGKFHQDKRVGKFYQLDENKYYIIIYNNDIQIKYECVDESNIAEINKPTK